MQSEHAGRFGGADAVFAIPLVDAVPDAVEVTWSFPEVRPSEWREVRLSGLNGNGYFQPSLGCFLVRTNGRTILCDAGIGPGPNRYLGGLRGRLPECLAAAGFRFSDVDAVVFTHLHMDHLGWAHLGLAPLRSGDSLARAEFFVGGAELAFWASKPSDAKPHHVAAFEESVRPLLAQGRLQTISGEKDFLPGVSLLPTPGHTPGHCSIRIACSGSPLVVTGDVFHCPAQVERPEWSHRADMDPGAAVRTRKRFVERAREEGWTLAAGHFREGLNFGKIVGACEPRFQPLLPATN